MSTTIFDKVQNFVKGPQLTSSLQTNSRINKSDRPTLLSLVYRYANTCLVYSTGLTIEPYQWDMERQRAHINQKSRAAREPFEMLNAHLDRYRGYN